MPQTTDIRPLLDSYAERGLLSDLRAKASLGNRNGYQFKWHYNRQFELLVDSDAKRVAFVGLLPEVSAGQPLFAEISDFVAGLSHDSLFDHRRIDAARVRLFCENDDGGVTVAAQAIDGDLEHAARKLIHAVNEIYFDFLPNSSHYQYQVEKLGLDPNAITFA